MVIAVAIGLVCSSATLAKKPPKPPGGGGGGPSYQIIALDTDDGFGSPLAGYAYDINFARLVVGTVYVPSTDPTLTVPAAAWWNITESDGELQSEWQFLTTPPSDSSRAYACNEWGETVGYAQDGEKWENAFGPALYWSTPHSSPAELPAPLDFSAAKDINFESVICGYSKSGNEFRALAWSQVDGQWQALELQTVGDPIIDEDGSPLPGIAFAHAISDADSETGLITIAGRSNENAVLWTVFLDQTTGALTEGTVTMLESGTSSSTALCLNNSGTTFGYIMGVWGVFWENGGGPVPLAEYKHMNLYGAGVPNDANENGMIVGYCRWGAVLWATQDSPATLLDDFLPKRNSAFSGLHDSLGVNEADEVVGFGVAEDEFFPLPFLAVPK
jgi:hypothetical protein